MIPAPAQGAMMVVAIENDLFSRDVLAQLNHEETAICTFVERQFLKTLEGGCTAPIGALAETKGDSITLKGALFSLDGKHKMEIEKSVKIDLYQNFGELCAKEILNSGGTIIVESIKKALSKKN
jgi:hydroxymethylbilane synthase